MRHKKAKFKRYNWADILIVFVLSVVGLMVFYPFYNSILVSLMPKTESLKSAFVLFPKSVTLSFYAFVFKSPAIFNGFKVTLIILIVGTFYNMFLTSTMAYALTKPIPGNKFFHLVVIFSMYFNGGLIPSYILVKQLGLLDNVLSMILPIGVNVSYLLVMMRFFKAIPVDIEESAMLDGCNEILVFLKIVLPLSLPILATYSLYYGVERWNEWYSGMLYIKSATKLPLQTVLRKIIQDSDVVTNGSLVDRSEIFSDGVKMATVVVTMLPIMCLYPFLQRYFVSGLTAGAVKS